jgi:hypothetical protein
MQHIRVGGGGGRTCLRNFSPPLYAGSDSCEFGSETSGSVKDGEFLFQLIDSQLFKEVATLLHDVGFWFDTVG